MHSLYTALHALIVMLLLHPSFDLFHLEGTLVRHEALVLRLCMVKLADGVRDFARHDRVHRGCADLLALADDVNLAVHRLLELGVVIQHLSD